MTDWPKRARELGLEWVVESPHGNVRYPTERALQLGREMADERAEAIAKAIEERKKEHIRPAPSAMFIQQGLIDAAAIARSFVEKKAEPKECAYTEAWIRADEREKCAGYIARRVTALHERIDTMEARKTRETVLEEALRESLAELVSAAEINAGERLQCDDGSTEAIAIIRRALEWKPS